MAEDERKPLWVKCEPCGHCWPAAYLPMEASTAAKLMKQARCPNCGAGPKGVVIAKQKDGILNEGPQEARSA